MTRGALLFAFNSPKVDYYAMAEYTAKRINHFLDLPVTIVTDEHSIPKNTTYKFDNVVISKPDKDNKFRDDIWINKGRYQAYEYTPYDETILLDVDYMVNSDRLLQVFDYVKDYACHQNIAQLMIPEGQQEQLSNISFPTLWATVLGFRKTEKTEQLFACMKMIQKNYSHYAALFNFSPDIYRNDFSLTIAHRLINGHHFDKSNILPWNLMHVWLRTKLFVEKKTKYNTKYTVIYDHHKNGKVKKEYITIKDMDFHVINKDVFLELM
jgi:hypothetical protein